MTWRRSLLVRCDRGDLVFSLFSQAGRDHRTLLTVTPAFEARQLATMEINPKVRNAAENGDLEQTVTGGPSQTGDVQISDDVFGEVGEDGPNYRNVGLFQVRLIVSREQRLTCCDRLVGSQLLYSC